MLASKVHLAMSGTRHGESNPFLQRPKRPALNTPAFSRSRVMTSTTLIASFSFSPHHHSLSESLSLPLHSESNSCIPVRMAALLSWLLQLLSNAELYALRVFGTPTRLGPLFVPTARPPSHNFSVRHAIFDY